MAKKHKKRGGGHFCWNCGWKLPNEHFSGRGHAQHVCRDCQKLGAAELAYRQAVRDIDRCMTSEGMIRRKQRPVLDRFLAHESERVRAYAQYCVQHDATEREARRLERQAWRAEEDGSVELCNELHAQAARLRGQLELPAQLMASTDPWSDDFEIVEWIPPEVDKEPLF
jgi:hypothetical protein